MMWREILLLKLVCAVVLPVLATAPTDLCIYGSTPSGIAAAVQAVRMGKSVVIVTPDRHLGGMSSSGLGFAAPGRSSARSHRCARARWVMGSMT